MYNFFCWSIIYDFYNIIIYIGETMKTTMYVYPLKDDVIPFRLDKTLVNVSYDKWNKSILIEDLNVVNTSGEKND